MPSWYAGGMADERIRLQKYLAERGLASRRHCERYIAEGRVSVNGVVVREQGTRVSPQSDDVAVDGRPIGELREPRRTIMLNKPRGLICSASARQGRTVYDLIPALGERLVPVGRLDKDSEGLLLLSNDGDLVQKLTHPRHGHTKVYEVTVTGPVTDDVLRSLRSPITVGNRSTRPAAVSVIHQTRKGTPTGLRFVLQEGRNRQIRRLCARAGVRVQRLIRLRIGRLSLGKLAPARWRQLTPGDIENALALGESDQSAEIGSEQPVGPGGSRGAR